VASALVAALLMLVVFNLVLKRPLVALAPAPLAARLPSSAVPSLLWTVVRRSSAR
jgi:hypothetical protein